MATPAARADEAAGPSARALEAAYLRCGEIARAHYENFPVISRFLKKQMRRPLAAVYAFARGADDLADEGYGPGGPSPEERLGALADWEDRLRATCAIPRSAPAHRLEQVCEDAIFLALGDTIWRHDLDPALFVDLLSAFRQDVMVTRYESRHDLIDYCRRSANPVGRIVLAVHGVRDSTSAALSDAICTGLQLANFWQDAGVDNQKNRVYLPREDQARHGVTEADLGAAVASPALRALVLEEARWARAYFESGRPLLDQAPEGLGFHLRLVWHGGMRILELIEAAGGDVLSKRPKLGRGEVARIFFRALAHGRNR